MPPGTWRRGGRAMSPTIWAESRERARRLRTVTPCYGEDPFPRCHNFRRGLTPPLRVPDEFPLREVEEARLVWADLVDVDVVVAGLLVFPDRLHVGLGVRPTDDGLRHVVFGHVLGGLLDVVELAAVRLVAALPSERCIPHSRCDQNQDRERRQQSIDDEQ